MSGRASSSWMGSWLLNPLRRWTVEPDKLLDPYVQEGMTVLEPGPGMGFFTLPLAKLVGPNGRVIAVDIQVKMIDKLRKRAQRAGLVDRIDLRLAGRDLLGIVDLHNRVDFVLAFAVVHEVASAQRFFREIAGVLRPRGSMLLVEPSVHVPRNKFAIELEAARSAGLEVAGSPVIAASHAALLRRI
jgi:ubiquinone/menaquinone biosynthesis C-methylase UbiE